MANAPVLKTGVRKDLGVRIPRPPLSRLAILVYTAMAIGGCDATSPSFEWTKISANGTVCALDTGGAAFCHGRNFYGELGDGTSRGDTTGFVAVAGGHRFVEVAVSEQWHVCALTSGGVAYCWGLNDGGQGGDNTTFLNSQ